MMQTARTTEEVVSSELLHMGAWSRFAHAQKFVCIFGGFCLLNKGTHASSSKREEIRRGIEDVDPSTNHGRP